jgi:hypothetical protein
MFSDLEPGPQALDLPAWHHEHRQPGAQQLLDDRATTTLDRHPGHARSAQPPDHRQDRGGFVREAHALVPLADVRQMTGDYAAAEKDLQHALTMSTELGNQLGEANALAILGMASHVSRTAGPRETWRWLRFVPRDAKLAASFCRPAGRRRASACLRAFRAADRSAGSRRHVTRVLGWGSWRRTGAVVATVLPLADCCGSCARMPG